MSLYNISAHPMLTPAVKEIVTADAPKFEQMVLLAETLLGLSTVYTDARAVDQAKLALAMQVNFQQVQGIDPFIQESGSSSQTRQSVVYRDVMVDPRAAQIIAGIVVAQEDMGDRFSVITSLRAE